VKDAVEDWYVEWRRRPKHVMRTTHLASHLDFSAATCSFSDGPQLNGVTLRESGDDC